MYQNKYQSSLIPPMFTPYDYVYNNNLGLTQIDKFVPVQKFTDSDNIEWSLVKASSDGTVAIPDPKAIHIIDYWNHEYPNINTASKIYVYVVEGIKQPKVDTEQASRVLYQWFSLKWVPSFTPSMITENEWLKANVYAASLSDSRVSKLNAICKVSTTPSKEDDTLIKVDIEDGTVNTSSERTDREG